MKAKNYFFTDPDFKGKVKFSKIITDDDKIKAICVCSGCNTEIACTRMFYKKYYFHRNMVQDHLEHCVKKQVSTNL